MTNTRFAIGCLMLGYVLLAAGLGGEAGAQVKPEGMINPYPWSAPLEDVRLKKN